MSYPQVAYFVVQLNLTSQGNIDGESQTARGDPKIIEAALPKKSGLKKHNLLGGEKDSFKSIRSRQESNLRRRIYDAWNVLKAASIILPKDRNEKYFMYNQQLVVQEEGEE